jgi:hypothetical protein
MPVSTTSTRHIYDSALTRPVSLLGASVLALVGLFLLAFGQEHAAAEWSTPQRIATQPPLEDPARLTGVSCPSDSFCAASDTFGNVVTSTDPMGGAGSWALTSAKHTDSSNGFSDISCPSASLCVATDIAGSISTSTNPTGGSAAWTLTHIPNSFALSGISCPSTSFCVAINGGELAISTNPAGGVWSTTELSEVEGVNAVSCPSASFCAAAASGGTIYTSTNPTGGSAAWSAASITGSELGYVSCPSSGLCVAGSGSTLYTSTNPTGGAGTWTGASVSLGSLSCPSATLCVGARNNEVVTSTNPTGGVGAWTAAAVDAALGFGISAVSCTTSSRCVAVREGKVITSTNPTGGSGAWSVAPVDSAGSTTLRDLACPSTNFCAAVDARRHVITSTNPINEAATWNSFDVNASEFFPGTFSSIDCPSATLCVATSGKEVTSSTNPTGGTASWNAASVDASGAGLSDLSCPSTTFCVAVDHEGRVLTSTNPTGGAAAWQSATIDVATDFQAVSCSSPTLCLAVDDAGNGWHSTNPAGGAPNWTSVVLSAGTEFNDISCVAGLCVAVASYPTFNVATTTNPTGASGTWSVYPLTSIGGRVVSCPSTSFCLAGGYYNGDYVAGSSNPVGGSKTWTAENPDPSFRGDHYVTAATCVTDALCLIGDKLGRVAFGAPKVDGGKGKEEQHSDPGNTCSVPACASSRQPTAQLGNTPAPGAGGKATIGNIATVVAGKALLQASCGARAACKGMAKLMARVSGGKATTSKAETVVIGSGRFSIPAGKSKVIKITLNSTGRQLVTMAGSKGLVVKLVGTGLRPRMVKLTPKPAKRSTRNRRTRERALAKRQMQFRVADVRNACVQAGAAMPRILDGGPWLNHPGDRKTQTYTAEADYRPLPQECQGVFHRIPKIRFQVQNPTNHAQWVDAGSYLSPTKTYKVMEEELEKVEQEREERGESCWRPIPGGEENICRIDPHIKDDGGIGEVFFQGPPARLHKPRYSRGDLRAYRCTPGQGTTHVRALFKSTVTSVRTGNVVGQRTTIVPVRVRSYPGKGPMPRAIHGAVRGPC